MRLGGVLKVGLLNCPYLYMYILKGLYVLEALDKNESLMEIKCVEQALKIIFRLQLDPTDKA